MKCSGHQLPPLPEPPRSLSAGGRFASAGPLPCLAGLPCTNSGPQFSTAKERARAHCFWACWLRRLSAGQSAGHRHRSDI